MSVLLLLFSLILNRINSQTCGTANACLSCGSFLCIPYEVEITGPTGCRPAGEGETCSYRSECDCGSLVSCIYYI